MELKELVGTDAYYRRTDGTEMTHEEFYDAVIEKLGGLEKILPFIPSDIWEISVAVSIDPHLNNIPLKRWEEAAGFFWDGQNCKQAGNARLKNLFRKVGVDTFSSAEAVSLLKEAARQWSIIGHIFLFASEEGTYRIGYKDPSIAGNRIVDSRTEFYADGDSPEEIRKNLYDLWDSFCKSSNLPVDSAVYVKYVTEQEI